MPPDAMNTDPYNDADRGHLERLRDRLMEEAREYSRQMADDGHIGTGRMVMVAVRSAESEAVRRALEDIDRLQSRLADMTEAVDLLRSMEWVDADGVDICPSCRRWKIPKDSGPEATHAPDCRLAKLIAT